MAQVSVHERIVSRPAGWERKGDQGGMGGLHVCLETHQKVVCRGLLDGNARTIEATRDGG